MTRRLAFLVLALLLALAPLTAWASCTNNTIFGPNGKVTFCTTCCYGGSCTTTCI
jgi:hypothetical protein